MRRTRIQTLALFCTLLALVFLAVDVAARGRGGGGRGGGRPNISRSGPAGGGSFGRSRGSMGSNRGSMSRPPTGQGGRGDRAGSRPNAPSEGRVNRGDARSDRGGDRNDQQQGRQDDRNAQQQDRQDNRGDQQQDRQDNRQDLVNDRQEFRQDVYGEYQERNEWYEDRWKYAVGASLTAATFRTLTCASRTVVVNGVTYYNCGPTWYSRAYTGGSVTYVVVTAPSGS